MCLCSMFCNSLPARSNKKLIIWDTGYRLLTAVVYCKNIWKVYFTDVNLNNYIVYYQS